MDKKVNRTAIYDLLYQLGVTANYIGFSYITYALSLCAEQPDRLLTVTRQLYPEVAKQYNTNWKAVERNIRTVSCVIWRENRPLLEHLACRHLERQPRNTQLLSILSASLYTYHPSVCGLDETECSLREDDNMDAVDEPVDEGFHGTCNALRGCLPAEEQHLGQNLSHSTENQALNNLGKKGVVETPSRRKKNDNWS